MFKIDRRRVRPKGKAGVSDSVKVAEARAPRTPKLPLTVLVCTPDVMLPHAQKTIRSIRETCRHIEMRLVVDDNNYAADFSHPKALNAALDRYGDGYLLICDDDVVLSDGAVDAALDYVEAHDDVGVVAFTLYDGPGMLWGSGMVLNPLGGHECVRRVFSEPVVMPTQCSCCWLIAPTKQRFDEGYRKYRFEHVFNFEQAEQGKHCIVLPNAVIHRKQVSAMAMMDRGALQGAVMCDKSKLRSEWIDTGRLWKVYNVIRDRVPVALPTGEHAVVQHAEERRAIVTVACGEAYAEHYGITIPLMERYARRCGADLIVVDERWMRGEATPHLLKWKCNAVFEMGYDRILFVDGADVLIMPWADNIFDEVPAGRLGAFNEQEIPHSMMDARPDLMRDYVAQYNAVLREHGHAAIETIQPGYFNSGVLLFGRDENPFREPVGGVVWFGNDPLFDQTYCNAQRSRFNIPVHWLDRKWNALLGIGGISAPQDGDLFRHYCSPRAKPQLLKDAAKIMPEPIERKPGPSVDGLKAWMRYAMARTPINDMAEIGSAYGESAWIFTGENPGLRLTCIDPWETCKAHAPRFGLKAKRDFMVRNGWNPNVTAITGFSVPESQKAGMFDAVYIDAVHQYEDVKQDIAAWLPRVRKGGFIGGHDYISAMWPGVCRAVNEWFTGPDMVFEDTSWIVRLT